MNKKDINYWEKRSAKRMWEHMESAEKTSKEIAKYYYKSSNYLGGKMDDVFDRYQTKHGLSEAEAKRLLNQMHDKSSINDLKLALQQSNDSQEKDELLQLLESPAYASRLQRFEELQQQLDDIMTNTYNIEKQLSTEHYKSLATNSFYRPIYDLQKGTGLGFTFAHISESEVDKLLHSKWSGTNYSKRIWQNTTKLAHTVKEEMMISLMTGRTNREVASVIQEKFGTGAFEARRLVRTESAFIVNEMEQQAYEECNIEKYMFVATLDKRTSEICQSMDHKVFKVKDRQPGVNCPPMHPFCRSTTIAYLDDETISNMERLATDDETGEKNIVPADLTYKDWLDGCECNFKNQMQYRTRYSKEAIKISRKGKEISTKKILGSKNVFIEDGSELTKYEASNACKAVDEAYKLLYGNKIKHKPNIYILKSDAFVGKTTGGYRVSDNSLFFNEAIFKKENLQLFTDEYVSVGDAKSHIIHELVHVQQNEEAKKIFKREVKSNSDLKEYNLLLESLAEEKVDDLIKQGYNYGVSRYAKESYNNHVYTEVMAELYTYLSLGGKKP